MHEWPRFTYLAMQLNAQHRRFGETLKKRKAYAAKGDKSVFGTYAIMPMLQRQAEYMHPHPRDVLAGTILGNVWGLSRGIIDARFLLEIC
jgi:hypothetical protein